MSALTAVPVMLEIGREPVAGAAAEALLPRRDPRLEELRVALAAPDEEPPPLRWPVLDLPAAVDQIERARIALLEEDVVALEAAERGELRTAFWRPARAAARVLGEGLPLGPAPGG